MSWLTTKKPRLIWSGESYFPFRRIGSEVGNNPVAYLIPCHRVIRKAGNISQYYWGETRKKAIIGWEASYSEVA